MKKINNNQYESIATVAEIRHKSTSYYGNPSKWVTFTDEEGTRTGYTATNAMCGYGCENYLNKKAAIIGHFTKKGNFVIDHMRNA